MSARDANLKLDEDRSFTANADSTAIDTEGGFLAWVSMLLGTLTGGGAKMDVYVQASMDEGSNYYCIGKFQQILDTHDDKFLRIPVYVPRPTTAGTFTKVRLHYVETTAGCNPFVIVDVFLEPMVSIAPPAIDEVEASGCAILLSAI